MSFLASDRIESSGVLKLNKSTRAGHLLRGSRVAKPSSVCTQHLRRPATQDSFASAVNVWYDPWREDVSEAPDAACVASCCATPRSASGVKHW